MILGFATLVSMSLKPVKCCQILLIADHWGSTAFPNKHVLVQVQNKRPRRAFSTSETVQFQSGLLQLAEKYFLNLVR